jgi:trimeric autotransporter adhesin
MDSNGPDTGVSRVNYFSGEALLTQDFKDEQKYHIQARQRLTSGIFSCGVIWGLDVTLDSKQPPQVTVAEGLAVDEQGHQIYLASEQTVLLDGKLIEGKENFLIVSYGEADGQYSDETGVSGVKRISENAVIDCVHTYSPGAPVSGASVSGTSVLGSPVLLAVIDADTDGNIVDLSYGNGTYQRSLVAFGGALELVPPGPPGDPANNAGPLKLMIRGPSAEFDGPITIGGADIESDTPVASLKVSPCELAGIGTLSWTGSIVTVSETVTPFFDVGDILIVDGGKQCGTVMKADASTAKVTIDGQFSPSSSSNRAYTFIRSKVAYVEAHQGTGALQVDVDGTVGIGAQSSTSAKYPLTIDPSGIVEIGQDLNVSGSASIGAAGDPKPGMALNVLGDANVSGSASIGAAGDPLPNMALNVLGDAHVSGDLSIDGNLTYKSSNVDGDFTVSGDIHARKFFGDGSGLTLPSVIGQWLRSDQDNSIYYPSGNVGIGDTAPSAPLTVIGGGVSRVGTGLISLIEGEKLSGFQTSFFDEVHAGDLITVGMVLQQTATIHRVDSGNTSLTLEHPFQLSLGPWKYKYQPAGGDLTEGEGTITCEGTQVTGTGTEATFKTLKAGDKLFIEPSDPTQTTSGGTQSWRVQAVKDDQTLTLLKPGGPSGQSFDANVSAFAVTSSLLMKVGAGKCQPPLQTKNPGTPLKSALTVCVNGDSAPAINTVAVNLDEGDVDESYALQVSGVATVSALSITDDSSQLSLLTVNDKSGNALLAVTSKGVQTSGVATMSALSITDDGSQPSLLTVDDKSGNALLAVTSKGVQTSGVATMSALSITDDGSQPTLLTVNDKSGNALLAVTPKGVQIPDLELGLGQGGVPMFKVTPQDVRVGGVVVGADGTMQCLGERGPKTYGLGDFSNNTLTSATPVLTDGFLTCTVGASGENDNAYYSVLEATVSGGSGQPIISKATGLAVQFTASSKYYGVPGTFTMPVRKGETWTITHTTDSTNKIAAAPLVSVVWTPFGPALPQADP